MANIFDSIVNGWENLTFDKYSFVNEVFEKLPDKAKLACCMDYSGVDLSKKQEDGSYEISANDFMYAQGCSLGIIDEDGNYDTEKLLSYLGKDYESMSADEQTKLVYYMGMNKYVGSALRDEEGTVVIGSEKYDDITIYLGQMSSLEDLKTFTGKDINSQLEIVNERMEQRIALSDDFEGMTVSLDAKTMLQYQMYMELEEKKMNGTLTKADADEYEEKWDKLEAMDPDEVAEKYKQIQEAFKENGFFGNLNKAESENESEQASDEVTDEEVHEPEENTADDIDSKQEEMSTESSDAKKTDSEKKDETSVADNKYAQMAEEKFGDIVNKADVQTSVDMQME